MVRIAAALLLLTPLTLTASAAESPGTADELAMGEGVSITIYNQDFGVVKERRLLELSEGRQTVKFTNIAAQIDATSVHFSSLTDPAGTRVVEQNFEFDLVSADKLMHKYIDRKISVITQDGGQINGFLMSYDRNQIVLAKDRKGNEPQIIPRARNVKDVRFPTLPEGLLTKPTLVWTIQAKKPGKHLIKIAYITSKVNWHAEYTAIASDDETRLDLSGWVSVNNRSGATYKEAGVKLMAGDVHRVKEREWEPIVTDGSPRSKRFGRAAFEEKAFAEYHLYTLGRRSTLADRQIKQIELLNAGGVPVKKVYTYRGLRTRGGYGSRDPQFGSEYDTTVTVRLRFKNDKASKMGMPLPKGKVRIYKQDTDGELEFLGGDSIDHTPKGERVDLYIGNASDLVGERKQTDFRRPARRVIEEDIRVRIRNHKDAPATVSVEEVMHRHRNWDITRHDTPFKKIDFLTVRFEIVVPANGEKTITYTVRYTW